MSDILLSGILNIQESELSKYKLHLACANPDGDDPLDAYLSGWEHWLGWNQWRDNKNDFNREFIFSFIRYYHEPDKWLFGGIFRVAKRFTDWSRTKQGYELEL